MVSSKGRITKGEASLKLEHTAKKGRKDRDEDRNEKRTQGNLKCKWKSEGSKAQN